jgi:hypothetical protein
LVKLDQPCGPSGIEIVVTRDALLVGEHFVSFEPNVALRAYPGWMDIHFTIVKPKGPAMHVNLRIPLAPGPAGELQGAQIVEAFRGARAAANANAPSKTKLLLFILGGFFSLTGVAIALAYLLRRGP